MDYTGYVKQSTKFTRRAVNLWRAMSASHPELMDGVALPLRPGFDVPLGIHGYSLSIIFPYNAHLEVMLIHDDIPVYRGDHGLGYRGMGHRNLASTAVAVWQEYYRVRAILKAHPEPPSNVADDSDSNSDVDSCTECAPHPL